MSVFLQFLISDSISIGTRRKYQIVSIHLGKSVTIRESNHASGVYKEHYTKHYVPKSFILLAKTGIWKISSLAFVGSALLKLIILIIQKV